jgi:hypothetical protein
VFKINISYMIFPTPISSYLLSVFPIAYILFGLKQSISFGSIFYSNELTIFTCKCTIFHLLNIYLVPIVSVSF